MDDWTAEYIDREDPLVKMRALIATQLIDERIAELRTQIQRLERRIVQLEKQKR